jgi:hypothetical protein
VKAEDAKQAMNPSMRVLVPAYFYPAGDGLTTWKKMIASHDPERGINIVAIANINSGNVGSVLDSNYQLVIRQAVKKGLTVIGYITSDYANAHGNASLEVAKNNVSDWFKLYPELQGIFVDEQTSNAAAIDSYYLPLRRHINSLKPNAFVVGNPGNNCAEDFLVTRTGGPVMDVVVIHENNESKLPYAGASSAAWTSAYTPDRLAMLAHTSPGFAAQVRLAKSRGVGLVFVTDAVGPPPDSIHPWGKLPTYWDDELKLVSEINRQPKTP